MNELLLGLLVLEGLVTLAGASLLVYRRHLEVPEQGQIILDSTEKEMEKKQEVVRGKVAVLSKYIKKIGVAWSVLAVAILVVWVVGIVRGL